MSLHHSWLPAIHCLLHTESRSTFEHPNLGDNNANGENTVDGQNSGLFQMNNGSNGIWDIYAKSTLHVDLSRASPLQQAEGFVIIVRIDGFYPWHLDGCSYPN